MGRNGEAMDRRSKVELFEQIRRNYTHGVGTIQDRILGDLHWQSYATSRGAGTQ